MKTPLLIFVTALCFTLSAYSESHSYTIQKGDTLYSISKKYNIRLESLKSYNNIDDPARLYPGMEILIPGGYVVKKGDTLYGIAKENGTTVDEILGLNDISLETILREGQFLHLPVTPGKTEIAVSVQTSAGTQKADSDDKPEVEVPEESGIGGGSIIWPHSGTRTALTGKLKGIQITGFPGDDIVSVSGGTVVWASEYGIFKKLVLVEGQNGLVYGYGGNESMNVKVGDYVAPGSIIGVLGGSDNGADAYFFVYKDGKPLDPAKAPRS